jgi:large subunit ribosomal protein L24
MDDIRHVIPLEDTDSGEMKIVIVDHAYAAGPYNERPPHSKLPRHSRYVSGLNIEIPWPVEEEPAITDGDMDTLRVEVETSTFVPTLRKPPFPSTIIDELRNKYSKFRTRHDPEYLQEKMMEDYRKEYKESVSMMTPKTDRKTLGTARAAERRKAMTDEDGKMHLSEKTQAFINSHLEETWKNSPKQKAKGKRAHLGKE